MIMKISTAHPTKPVSPRKEQEAKRIVEERGWQYIGPTFDGRTGKWTYRYEDQFGEQDSHTLARLKDLSCSSRVPYIGEKLCRLIIVETLSPIPKQNWQYNKRYKWILDPISGNPLELDIYSESDAIAVEHNGRHHEQPHEIIKDTIKREACKSQGVKLLQIRQPEVLRLDEYCDLFEKEFIRLNISYDQDKLAQIRNMSGADTMVNKFICACYAEFTQKVLDYIDMRGGKLLTIDGALYQKKSAITKKSKLSIDTRCRHSARIIPEAWQLLQDETWCKSCNLQKTKEQGFQSFMDGLQERCSYYEFIGVDLLKVQRDEKGGVSLHCEECKTSLNNRSREFLEDLKPGWCASCDGRNSNSEFSLRVKYAGRCEDLGWKFEDLREGLVDAHCGQCACALQVTTRQLTEFKKAPGVCCPTSRTGGAEVSPVKYILNDVGRLLRAIYPDGVVVAERLTEDRKYWAHCGCEKHPNFQFDFNALRKAVARHIINELVDRHFLKPDTPFGTNVSVVSLVTDACDLVWDPEENYAQSAKKFLLSNWDSTSLSSDLAAGRRSVLIPVSALNHLRKKNYACVSCDPNAKRKGRSLDDFLERVRQVDEKFARSRSAPSRNVDFKIDPNDPKLFHVQCGAVGHPPFTRTRSNWNRIEERYCPDCKSTIGEKNWIPQS